MIVLLLIGLLAIAVAAVALTGIRLRSDAQNVEPFDPVEVEREVYDHLYGPRPALGTTPTRPANRTRQRPRRSRGKLNTKRPVTGRPAH